MVDWKCWRDFGIYIFLGTEQCGSPFRDVAADTIVAIINLEICIFIN